jgi:hypothetical protein
MKWMLLWGATVIAAIAAYMVADKPIVRTIEVKDSEGKNRRLNIIVIAGIGNTINYNYKDEV